MHTLRCGHPLCTLMHHSFVCDSLASQAWVGFTAEWNTWEPADNIEPSLISDYEERQCDAEAEEDEEDMPLSLRLLTSKPPKAVAEPPKAAEPMESAEPMETAGPLLAETEAEGVEVEQAQVVELSIQKILAHFVFPGAKVGSLQKVCVRVLYSDGSRSDYIPSEPLHGSAILCKYLKSKNGQKIQKYAS
jgi:hypothetical protein